MASLPFCHMKKAVRSTELKKVEAPKGEDRPVLLAMLGERQYLIGKLAQEIAEITRRLDEANKKAPDSE